MRFGLSVLNRMVASNHIHLLGKDTGANISAERIQLIDIDSEIEAKSEKRT
jgi:hypothetical protein